MSESNVQVVRAAPQLIAAIRATAPVAQLPSVIPAVLGEVWAFIRSNGMGDPGRNIVLYHDCVCNMEIGVEVPREFVGNERVICSKIPGGRAAMATHVGPYNQMRLAYQALEAWSARTGEKLVSPSWEVYDHMRGPSDVPRTDVYFTLQNQSGA